MLAVSYEDLCIWQYYSLFQIIVIIADVSNGDKTHVFYVYKVLRSNNITLVHMVDYNYNISGSKVSYNTIQTIYKTHTHISTIQSTSSYNKDNLRCVY